jgi:hypothetical protein
MANLYDGQGELNLRLSAEDLSGLGPDAERALRQLAGSQQEQRQRQSTAFALRSELPARIPPAHGQQMTHRPVSFEPAAGPPGYNTHHHTVPSSWQHQAAAQQPRGMDLDDFGEL